MKLCHFIFNRPKKSKTISYRLFLNRNPSSLLLYNHAFAVSASFICYKFLVMFKRPCNVRVNEKKMKKNLMLMLNI